MAPSITTEIIYSPSVILNGSSFVQCIVNTVKISSGKTKRFYQNNKVFALKIIKYREHRVNGLNLFYLKQKIQNILI